MRAGDAVRLAVLESERETGAGAIRSGLRSESRARGRAPAAAEATEAATSPAASPGRRPGRGEPSRRRLGSRRGRRAPAGNRGGTWGYELTRTAAEAARGDAERAGLREALETARLPPRRQQTSEPASPRPSAAPVETVARSTSRPSSTANAAAARPASSPSPSASARRCAAASRPSPSARRPSSAASRGRRRHGDLNAVQRCRPAPSAQHSRPTTRPWEPSSPTPSAGRRGRRRPWRPSAPRRPSCAPRSTPSGLCPRARAARPRAVHGRGGARACGRSTRLVADLDAAAEALRSRTPANARGPAPGRTNDESWPPDDEPPAPAAEPAVDWDDREEPTREPCVPGVEPVRPPSARRRRPRGSRRGSTHRTPTSRPSRPPQTPSPGSSGPRPTSHRRRPPRSARGGRGGGGGGAGAIVPPPEAVPGAGRPSRPDPDRSRRAASGPGVHGRQRPAGLSAPARRHREARA